MTFAKCISSDLDLFACASSARDVPSSRRHATMRHMLGWGRSSHADSNVTPNRILRINHDQDHNQSHVSDTIDAEKKALDIKHPEQQAKNSSDPATDISEAKAHSLAPPTAVSQSREASRSLCSSNNNSTCESSGSTPEDNNANNQKASLAAAWPKPMTTSTSSPPPTVSFRKGEKSFLDFHQHYAITRHLGEGSYSTVKQVTHRKKGGVYACKIVDKLSLSPVDRQALSHEVRVLASVSHENIMRLYEVIEDDAKCYLVTEHAESGDLFDRIVKQGKFPEREAQKVTAALIEAVAYCHARCIIHRDIKPENVLLSGDNVKLCDFGFAKQLQSSDEQSSDSCGTPGYAAPEILDGRSYGLEVDIFSLGVVTYIMLCGYPPFPMKLAQLRAHRFNVRFPSKDWAHVNPDVKDMISRMLSVNPMARPSAQELRLHPWVRAGKATLDRLLREAEERRRLADLTRKQQSADWIRKKLAMGGFEVVKYGRNGLPHRTKLRLSTDGKSVSWQPKLLKRSLLRYHNARSLASLFGGLGRESNSSSHPQLHAGVPQVERSSVYDQSNQSTAASENDDHTSDSTGATTSARTTSNGSCCSAASIGSTATSSSSANTASEKRLWWRSLRRERGHGAERTASGGFVLPFTSKSAASSPTSHAPPPLVANDSPVASPRRGQSQGQSLDDTFNIMDIQTLLLGEDSAFFAGHANNSPNSCKRAVDLACVLSVVTRTRELHLEFANQDLRNGFAYLLEQIALPLTEASAAPKAYCQSTTAS